MLARLMLALIAPGIVVVPGTFVEGRQPDGNSVVIEAPGGVIVVDTGRHDAHTRKVLEAAAATEKPLVAIVNTHWHLDHISGNAVIRDEAPEVRVFASDALDDAMKGFLANYKEYLEEAIAKTPEAARSTLEAELARIESGPRLAPDEIITASGTREIAGRALEIHLVENAVTAGDLWLLDPETKVLIAGDLVTLPVPFLDTACPDGWREALDELGAVEFTTLIPGHGPAMSRRDFARYRAAFGGLLDCASSQSEVRACADRWIDGLGPLLPEADHAFTRNLLDYYVGQILRGDAKQRLALCGG